MITGDAAVTGEPSVTSPWQVRANGAQRAGWHCQGRVEVTSDSAASGARHRRETCVGQWFMTLAFTLCGEAEGRAAPERQHVEMRVRAPTVRRRCLPAAAASQAHVLAAPLAGHTDPAALELMLAAGADGWASAASGVRARPPPQRDHKAPSSLGLHAPSRRPQSCEATAFWDLKQRRQQQWQERQARASVPNPRLAKSPLTPARPAGAGPCSRPVQPAPRKPARPGRRQ